MKTARPAAKAEIHTRRLEPADLVAVVAIDRTHAGHTRGAYFLRRLEAAQRDPALHAQFAALENGKLSGFLLARVMEGEFGRSEPALRLESLGVAPAVQGRGLGAQLGKALEDEARRRGVKELRTAASWRQHAMLRFLDRGGWSLGQAQVVDCALGDTELGGPREAPVVPPRFSPGDANDYSVPQDDDFGALARDVTEVGVLKEGDLEGIVRIDQRLTGRDRSAFLRHALSEALVDSAVRVSLAARADGNLAGFLMARVDLGDFGRAEPVAVIDTVGVDPLRARQGFGRALLSQLFANLGALGVERVETLVMSGDFGLARFFHLAGLRPAERFAFVKRLG